MTTLGIDARMLGPSGIGRYLGALLPRVLPALAPRSVTVFGHLDTLRKQRWAELPHVTVKKCHAPVYGPTEQAALARIAAGTSSFWSPHVNVPVFYGGRLVVTVHDTYHLLPEARRAVRLDKRLYLQQLYRAVARKADRILCVSDFGAKEVKRRLGVARDRITVIPNGVDAETFGMSNAGPPVHERPYLLFVGNDKPHKNLRRLMLAFDRVADDLEHDLLLVGRCAGADADNPRPERIRRQGAVDDDTLRRLYAQATALVMPSLYEGFGLPPLEAMASDTPVVAARAASLPEVCGDAALYIDPYRIDDMAAAITTICRDVELRQQLVTAGRARVATFTWSRAAEATTDAL